MESQRRNVWIAVAVGFVFLCCCMTMAVVVGASLMGRGLSGFGLGTLEGKRIEQTFDLGRAPDLKIDNYAGRITVRVCEDGSIQVIATKQASRKSDLDRIQVTMVERDGGLVIKTEKPSGLGNSSVDLEITAPAGTRFDLDTGAGSVTVQGLTSGKVHTGAGSITALDLNGAVKLETGSGSVTVRGVEGDVEVDTGAGGVIMERVTGEIDAHTGTGGMEAREAAGVVRLDSGSGGIEYQGAPWGDCRFETGSGSITLDLPPDLSMEVDLDTGIGSLEVGYDVAGTVSRLEAKGVVGDGSQGSIRAHTGAGSIHLVRR